MREGWEGALLHTIIQGTIFNMQLIRFSWLISHPILWALAAMSKKGNEHRILFIGDAELIVELTINQFYLSSSLSCKSSLNATSNSQHTLVSVFSSLPPQLQAWEGLHLPSKTDILPNVLSTVYCGSPSWSLC